MFRCLTLFFFPSQVCFIKGEKKRTASNQQNHYLFLVMGRHTIKKERNIEDGEISEGEKQQKNKRIICKQTIRTNSDRIIYTIHSLVERKRQVADNAKRSKKHCICVHITETIITRGVANKCSG